MDYVALPYLPSIQAFRNRKPRLVECSFVEENGSSPMFQHFGVEGYRRDYVFSIVLKKGRLRLPFKESNMKQLLLTSYRREFDETCRWDMAMNKIRAGKEKRRQAELAAIHKARHHRERSAATPGTAQFVEWMQRDPNDCVEFWCGRGYRFVTNPKTKVAVLANITGEVVHIIGFYRAIIHTNPRAYVFSEYK